MFKFGGTMLMVHGARVLSLVQSNVLINNAEEQSAPDKNGDITTRSLGMILVRGLGVRVWRLGCRHKVIGGAAISTG